MEDSEDTGATSNREQLTDPAESLPVSPRDRTPRTRMHAPRMPESDSEEDRSTGESGAGTGVGTEHLYAGAVNNEPSEFSLS